MSKLKICVIFGGNSSEHEISCVSAKNVLNNLNKEKYEIYPIGITKGGEWKLFTGNIDSFEPTTWENTDTKKVLISPDTGDKCIYIFKGQDVTKVEIDAVFVIIHGKNGEDGTIQGLLEMSGIPYAGPGVLASALCMDKVASKHIFEAHGIPVTAWDYATAEDMKNPEAVVKRIEETFTYPIFVKPSSGGSSIGAMKVSGRETLVSALNNALAYDEKALVEEFINAREIETAVMGNSNPQIALPGEIIANSDFYDFDAKYVNNTSQVVIPANIPDEKIKEIQELAIKSYKAVGCKGFSRVDFFYERETGRVLLNEINTLPGFTDISMFPMMWQKSGVSFSELLDKLIAYAMER